MSKKKMIKNVSAWGLFLTLGAASIGNVMAARPNISDQEYNFDVSALNFGVKTGPRTKNNRTAVYGYVKHLEAHKKVQVRAYGYKSKGNIENLTLNGTTNDYTSYIICYEGRKQSIHTTIKEKKYPKAQLGFRSTNLVLPERVRGVWSPDSSKNYSPAWK